MTSKEALKDIKEWVEYFADWKKLKHFEKNEFEEALSEIAKDLETLEILQNKLSEYEALEKQGRLIKLPCAVGDKIYTVNFPYITTDEIEKISINYETRTGNIKEYQIGTYVFFNREAAEALLEQMKKWLENK